MDDTGIGDRRDCSDRHPFNGLFSTTTWVSRQANLDFNEARDDEVAVVSARP